MVVYCFCHVYMWPVTVFLKDNLGELLATVRYTDGEVHDEEKHTDTTTHHQVSVYEKTPESVQILILLPTHTHTRVPLQ